MPRSNLAKNRSLLFYCCLLVEFLLLLLGNLLFVAVYPLAVALDVVMMLASFNYACFEDDYMFWMTSMTVKLQLELLCSK